MPSDCCLPPSSSNNWMNWQQAKPQDITDLVANAVLAGATGVYMNSSTYANQSWIASPFTINSNPTCAALGTDSIQNVADAAQWNFQNQTANLAATTALPLQKVIFLRAGTNWQMNIQIAMGGSTYTEIQLGLLENAGTRGDAQGTYPVIDWTGSFSGNVTLGLTLKMPGRYTFGLWAKSGTNFSMMEINAVVIADQNSQTLMGLGDLQVSSFVTSSLPQSPLCDTDSTHSLLAKCAASCPPFKTCQCPTAAGVTVCICPHTPLCNTGNACATCNTCPQCVALTHTGACCL